MDHHHLRIILQTVVGLVILNVWLLRANRSTPYRGGDSGNLREEFAAYGLPGWSFYLIGGLKIACALGLLAGWIHALTTPSAAVLAVLMAGAFTMHLKVKDPFRKAWPSLAMLAMCLTIVLL